MEKKKKEVEKQPVVLEQKLIQVAPGKVKILKNVRVGIDKTGLADLARSIKENGLIQPITVRKTKKGGVYQLVVGQRRLLASRIAKVGLIEAILQKTEDADVTSLQIVENIEREDITPLEKAYAYIRMSEEDCLPVASIAAKMHKSVKEVKLMMNISKCVPALLKEITSGAIPLEKGLVLAKFSRDIQDTVINQRSWILNRSLKEIEKTLMEKFSGDLASPGFPVDDASYSKENGACTQCKYNTFGNGELFGPKESRCVNLPCFAGKRKLHFQKIVTVLDNAKSAFHLITESSIVPDKYEGRPVLDRNDWILAPNNTAAPIKQGLLIDSKGFGTMHKIVLKVDLKKIDKKARDLVFKRGDVKEINALHETTPDERYAKKVDKISSIGRSQVLKGLQKVIVETVIPYKYENMLKMFLLIMRNLDYNTRHRIDEYLGLERYTRIDPKVFAKKVPDFESLTKLIVQCMVEPTDEVYHDTDEDLLFIKEFALANLETKVITQINSDVKKFVTAEVKDLTKRFEARWLRKPIEKLK